MPEEKDNTNRELIARQQVDLAVERTELALKRTHLAWIRTTFTIMTSGIAIDKGLEFVYERHLLKSQEVLKSGHIIGIFMSLAGLLLLIFETINFVKRSRELSDLKQVQFSFFSIYIQLSILVMLIGLALIYLMTTG